MYAVKAVEAKKVEGVVFLPELFLAEAKAIARKADLKTEITPYTTKVKDKDGNEKDVKFPESSLPKRSRI